MTTEMDRAIVGWQHAEVMYMQATRSAASTNESVLAQRFWDEAYWLREHGHHLTAFRMLRWLCSVKGFRKRHLLAMLKLVPHKLLNRGKRNHISRPA